MSRQKLAEVRPVRKTDNEGVIALLRKHAQYHSELAPGYFRTDLSQTEWNKYLRGYTGKRKAKMFVAVQNEKVVGIISGKVEKPISILIAPRLTGMITRAYVDDQYRKKGIGRHMMVTMLDWFRNKGVKFANIGSIGANKLGTKVWKNLGFEIESYRLVTKL